MTANQIAAASERELERHNSVVEDETIRHNQEAESIEKTRNEITNNYQTEKNRLDDWYNRAYIDYLNASQEDKVRLQEELNSIEIMKAENDKDYKSQMAAIEDSKAKSDAQYKGKVAEANYMQALVAERRQEYESAIGWEKLGLEQQELISANNRAIAANSLEQNRQAIEKLKNEQNYFISMQAATLNYIEEARKLKMTDAEISKMLSETVRNYMDAAMKPLNTIPFE